MKSRMHILAVVAALALLAGACSGSAPNEGGGEGAEGGGGELVWAIGGADAAPGGTHRQVADLWNEQNPDGPTVRIEQLPDQADEQRQQLALDLQSQTGEFDILGVDVIWTGEYSTNGWLESLEDVRGEIEDVTLEGPFQTAVWEDQLWAAPYNSNAGFLYYRTDLLDEPPSTWEELRQACDEVATAEGINCFVGQGAQYEGMVVNFLEYYWGAGGELLTDDGSEAAVDENAEAAQTALEFMQTNQEEGYYAPGFNTMDEEAARAEFQSGNALFMRNWPYAYNLMSGEGENAEDSAVAGNYDIAPIPTFDGGGISALGGFNLAVSAFSDNIEAAKEFVTWASTDQEVQQLLLSRNLPPTLASAYEGVEDPVNQLLAEILPESRPRPPAPTWNAVSEAIQQVVFPAYNGETPVDQAVTNLEQEVNTALGG